MTQESRLPGVALVTGAASGIGAAVSHAFARNSTSLILTDINTALLESVRTSLLTLYPDLSIILLPGDISQPDFITTLFASIRNTPAPFNGRIDYAVNCAGVLGSGTPTTETSLEAFDRINGINYRGLFMCVKEELKIMMEQDIKSWERGRTEKEREIRGQRGAIVNIASQLGIVGRPDAPAYCASKSAVLALTRSDAIDYSTHRIRVNAVCPGVIATPMTTDTPEKVERLAPAVQIAPMKRMGLPEEIADAAVWLCSGEASFVQGAQIVVDGGYIIS